MKTIITIVALFLFIFTNNSNSQYAVSVAQFNNTAAGQSISFTSPCSGGGTHSGFAGLLNCTVDGNPTQFYCIDICRNIAPGDTIRDSALGIPRVIYILNNYYPYVTSYPGKLADNQEATAIQVAIWHIRHGLDISTVTGSNDVEIKQRAIDIVADADQNGTNTTAATTLEIAPDADPAAFIIRTFDQNGSPIAVNNIQLTISQGSLSTNITSTNSSGESLPVTVIGTSTGIITAKATATIPQGWIYSALAHNKQALIIAKPVLGNVETSTDWGALPVELASFSADINGRNVRLSWITASESNNAGFDIERVKSGSSDWTSVGNVSGNGTTTSSNSYSFVDRNVVSGKYNYRLKQIDYNGNYEYHNLNSEIVVGAPDKFNLLQNYPNPFNPTTKIDFDIANDSYVSLKIYNSSGKEIATLVNEFRASGYHSVVFDASKISSGIYYYKLEATGFSKVMKMALIK